MRKWTEEEINEVIKLKDRWGKPIDVFKLHGILFVGNTEAGEWNLAKKYTLFAEHSIGFSLSEFYACETEADVFEVFNEGLRCSVSRRLL